MIASIFHKGAEVISYIFNILDFRNVQKRTTTVLKPIRIYPICISLIIVTGVEYLQQFLLLIKHHYTLKPSSVAKNSQDTFLMLSVFPTVHHYYFFPPKDVCLLGTKVSGLDKNLILQLYHKVCIHEFVLGCFLFLSEILFKINLKPSLALGAH